MTDGHVLPTARVLKPTAVYVVACNSKSSRPWEVWFTASCGAPVFFLSVHKDRQRAADECLRLNNPAAAGAAVAAADIPMRLAA